MRFEPIINTGSGSQKEKQVSESVSRVTRWIAILVAFAATFGFFIKILYF